MFQVIVFFNHQKTCFETAWFYILAARSSDWQALDGLLLSLEMCRRDRARYFEQVLECRELILTSLGRGEVQQLLVFGGSQPRFAMIFQILVI